MNCLQLYMNIGYIAALLIYFSLFKRYTKESYLSINDSRLYLYHV